MTVINLYPPKTTDNEYKVLAYQAHILLSMMKLNEKTLSANMKKSNNACCKHREDA